MAEAREAARLFEEGRPLPVGDVPDVSAALERARVGGVLAPDELVAVGRMLTSARALRRFLGSRKAELPALFTACATDPTLDDLADEIGGSFEADGTLADRATPRLRELRGEWRAARQRMLARMDDLMKRYESIVQDRFVTEREGRWVLPVRSDAHERFPGIVHSTSSSGATLFVEPRAVIPMGNRLKVLEAEVRREEEAAYARLTALVADALPSANGAAQALGLADLRAAVARLGHDLSLTFPVVIDEPRLELLAARHPLLALETKDVVPSDLALEAGCALVVSGPNAGGKTVTLTTLGLAALMVRAGMPLACGEGSVVGIFDVVLTDVGDDQSLQKNLSTFSAHVKNLAGVLGDTCRGALVLLDEPRGRDRPARGRGAGGRGARQPLRPRRRRGRDDPLRGAQGAGRRRLALQERERGLQSLDDDAHLPPRHRRAGRLERAGGGETLRDPGPVVERAERFLTREDQTFEQVVKRLDDERAALELARLAAQKTEEQAREARDRLDGELRALKEREKKTLSDEAAELLDRLRRAREELRAAQARLRSKKVDAAGLRETERALDRISGEVAVGVPSTGRSAGSTPRETRGATAGDDRPQG